MIPDIRNNPPFVQITSENIFKKNLVRLELNVTTEIKNVSSLQEFKRELKSYK